MKTILKIIAILIVTSLVAGGFWLAFGSSASTTSGQPTNNGQTNFQPMERPDGGDQGGSIAGGLGGIFLTLVKITGITAIVLLIEKVFSMKNNRGLSTVQH